MDVSFGLEEVGYCLSMSKGSLYLNVNVQSFDFDWLILISQSYYISLPDFVLHCRRYELPYNKLNVVSEFG